MTKGVKDKFSMTILFTPVACAIRLLYNILEIILLYIITEEVWDEN